MVRQRGFTIIEVLLFLSISGLLFMFAVVSLTRSIQTTRFTDATNGLESFLTQQYDDVRNNVSYRPDGSSLACVASGTPQEPGTSDNCIVIGKLLDIRASGASGANLDLIKTFTIVANRCPDVIQPTENGCPGGTGSCPMADTTSAGMIGSYCPRILPAAYSEDYTIMWGSSLPPDINVDGVGSPNPRALRASSAQERVNRIAIIHSPTSERIYTYSYFSSGAITGTTIQNIQPAFLTGATADTDTMLCLRSADSLDSFHFVAIGAGQGTDLISGGQAVEDVNAMVGGMRCS